MSGFTTGQGDADDLSWNHEANGDKAEKAIVVFEVSCAIRRGRNDLSLMGFPKDEESISKCMADPKRNICSFRSAGRVAGTDFEISIKHYPAQESTRTVWIQMTGPRLDDRSRSASPQRRPAGQEDTPRTDQRGDRLPYGERRLPEKVIVHAVPRFQRMTGRLIWNARVLPYDVPPENLRRRTMAETGKEPIPLTEIDMTRRVPEKDVSGFDEEYQN